MSNNNNQTVTASSTNTDTQSSASSSTSSTSDQSASSIDQLKSDLPQQVEWIEVPQDLKEAGQKMQVESEFLSVNCLCGQHPALTHIMKGPYIVASCTSKGMIWVRKPQDFDSKLFKSHMTTIRKKQAVN